MTVMNIIITTRACDPVAGGPAGFGRKAGAALAIAAASLAGAPAQADMIDTSGMKPWETCALCHGLDGISRMPKFPRLAGQRPGYIEKQLKDFLEGRRGNDGGQMEAIVTEISRGDIPAVAAHFAQAGPPAPVEADASPRALARAKRIFETGDAEAAVPACKGCHAFSPDGPVTGPRITAQHPGYLAKQLRDFRSGERANDPDGAMAEIARKLSDADIEALAAHIAARPREGM